MADTVVEHHHEATDHGANTGLILGIIILAILVFLAIFYFGFGGLNLGRTTSAPQPSVPEQVDVNINR